MKKIMLIVLVTCAVFLVNAQIKMNSSGNVGLGGYGASSSYDVRAYKTWFYLGYQSKSRVYQNMGIGTSWSSNATLTVSALGVAGEPDAAVDYVVYIGGGSYSPNLGVDLFVNGSAQINGGVEVTSDRRLKTNIKKIDSKTLIEKIKNIKGRTYKFKSPDELRALHLSGKVKFHTDTLYQIDSILHDDGTYDYVQSDIVEDVLIDVPKFPQGRHYGLIAQDVKKEFRELVQKDTVSGIWSVNYDGFIPVLLEAIKIQQKQIESLEKRLASLKDNEISTSNARTHQQSEGNDAGYSSASSSIWQSVPNPSSGDIRLSYYLAPNTQSVEIFIYDMNGAQLKSYPIARNGNGRLNIVAGSLKAGMYIYSLIADGKIVDTRKMVLTR